MDILFLAYNRLRFTKSSLQTMLANTNPSLVDRIIIYDDGSTDGTREYLRTQVKGNIELRESEGLGPVGILRHYLEDGAPTTFAKIDNDVLLPKRWLEDCLKIMDGDLSIDLLGIEAVYEVDKGPRRFVPAEYIGGIGLMRSRAFDHCVPRANGRFGFTAWQDYHPQIIKGWISPAIPVCLLNLVPFEPWLSLSREYVEKGWQRDWPGPYSQERRALWEWWA